MGGPGGTIRQMIGSSAMRVEQKAGTYDGYIASNWATRAGEDAKR